MSRDRVAISSPTTDESWLSYACNLALRGPLFDPNPRVGCVIVKNDQIIAQGWHQGAGTPHAEAAAITAAQNDHIDLTAATAYVSLEPCQHTGRTPPCANALIDAGISRVVYAAADPNPIATGGAAVLSSAGIEVRYLPIAEAIQINRYWEFAIRHQRPFVTWKFAATLDGYSAAADGTSQWITGAAVRNRTHHLRAQCGAIIAGTGTVIVDDPHLTARPDGKLASPQPLRVIMGHRPIPATANVFNDDAATMIIPSHDPLQVLAELHVREIRHVWLEGGPTVAAAFLQAGLIDEVIACLSPTLLGTGIAAVADFGASTLNQALRWTPVQIENVAEDIMITMRKET